MLFKNNPTKDNIELLQYGASSLPMGAVSEPEAQDVTKISIGYEDLQGPIVLQPIANKPRTQTLLGFATYRP